MASGVSPERAEWRTIWLGTQNDTPDKGWYPIDGEVRTTRLATFERKLTIGDATKDSDDFISSWIIGDFTGGGQIFDINEGSDIGRFWFGVSDTRFVNQLSLPPEVVEYTLPVNDVGGVSTIPLGDVPQTGYVAPGTVTPDASGGVAYGQTFVVWYNGKLYDYLSATSDPSNAAFQLWNVSYRVLETDEPAAVTYVPKPETVGVPYHDITTNDDWLFVPSRTHSYALSARDGLVFAYYRTTATSTPQPLKLISAAVYKDVLYGLTEDGRLYKGTDIRSRKNPYTNVYSGMFTPVNDALGQQLKLPLHQVPQHLTKHFVNMEQKLLAVTDEQIFVLDTSSTDAGWLETPAKFPPGFNHGQTSAQWRSGEDLWVTIGPDVLKYTNSQVMIPNSGPVREDGLPFEMSTVSDSRYPGSMVVSLSPEYNNLYALMYHNNGNLYPDMSLMCFTGTGWHCLWQGGNASAPDYLFSNISTAQLKKSDVPDNTYSMYRLWFGTYGNKIYGMDLRKSFHNARVGARARVDRFASKVRKMGAVNELTDPWLETGRFDANMRNFDKLASHVTVDMEFANASNYLKIKYQTDRDLDALNGTPYTMASSGDIGWHDVPIVVNKIGTTKIPLPGLSGFNAGIPFKWIRFKIELVGPGGLDTPIMNNFILAYTKIPQDSASFVFTVPLPRETFIGRTGQEMDDALQSMLVNQQFLKFVHQNRTYRVRMAGLSGADSSGDDYAGARTLNLIEIPDA